MRLRKAADRSVIEVGFCTSLRFVDGDVEANQPIFESLSQQPALPANIL